MPYSFNQESECHSDSPGTLLAFLERFRCVGNAYRYFDKTKAGLSDLLQDFARMFHTIHREMKATSTPPGHGADAIVSIGNRNARIETGEQDSEPKDEPAHHRHSPSCPQKPGAQREIRAFVSQRLQQPIDISSLVLSIQIKRHNVFSPVLERKSDPGLQRRALPEIDGVPEYPNQPAQRLSRRAVPRTIVNNDDILNETNQHI